MLRPSKSDVDVLEEDVARRIKALEEPEFIDIVLGFDPSPLPPRLRVELGGPTDAEQRWSAAELAEGRGVPIVKRRGADGRDEWVLKVLVVA